MISIDYLCGFANRLFQYSIANIVAKRHGLMLPAFPIEGFPQTYKNVDGIKCDGEPEVVQTPADVYNILNRKVISRPLRVIGLFQKANLYLNNQSDIKERWIRLDSSIHISEYSTMCDLIIHIRRGDYLLHNWGAPFSFYQEAIESSSFNKVCIITDDPRDPFLKRFQKYKPTVICSHYLSDFALLTRAKKLILSPSTFSWWGAFLSNAEKILFPIPQHGIWSPDYGQEVDLTMPSRFTQYKYIRCNEPLRLNAVERIYFERKYLSHKLRNQGITGYCKGHAQSAIKFGRQLLQWNT